jgi:two-component system, OmpR family, sensor histidine kinase VicK
VVADGRRMEQVLENLLNNALRYVPRGARVRVSLSRAPGGGGLYELKVSDNGPGIPPGEMGLVFERFYRGEGAGRAEVPGSGLGLAIVKEIVERHGGTVRAESNDPHGLSILVELPAA